MTVTRPTYATREDVKQALDVKLTARMDAQVDQRIEAASDAIDGELHRVFYPTLTTVYVDWPNFQYTYPWKVYLDAAELADVTVNVPVVTSGGNVIPNADIFWGHPRYAPPYTWFELNRATSATFGQGNTPQRDVAITGNVGYWIKTASAGTLAAAMTDTTSTTLTAANGAGAGVGDYLVIDSERLLLTDKAMVSTGQTQQGSGVSTASVADVTLGVTDGTKYFVGETLLLNSERMYVVDIAGNSLTVERGWDGTVVATHTGATIYGLRSWTVTRGALGATAATHSNGAAVSRGVAPGLIRELCIAEAVSKMIRISAGFPIPASRRGDAVSQTVPGTVASDLGDLWARATTAFGRTARSRTV